MLAALTTIAALVAVTPLTASADPGVADHLNFTVGPTPSDGTVDGTVDVTVEVQDTDNVAVPGNTDTITLSLNSEAIDSGDTVSAVDGTATFSVKITTPGTGYKLTAHDEDLGTVTDATSTSFNLDPGAAAKLEFGAQPTSTYTGDAITDGASGPVKVKVEDQYGNLRTNDSTTNVSMALATGSFTGLSTTTSTASSGIASFSNLHPSVSAEATGNKLTASSTPLPPVDSNAFNVVPQADLSITKTGPSEQFAGLDIEYSILVTNNGPSTAANTHVTDTLPSAGTNARYCTVGCNQPVSSETNYTGFSGDIALSAMAPGSQTIVVRVHVPSSTNKDTLMVNGASVSSATHDPVATNDTATPTVQTTIKTQADLGITVSSEPATSGQGSAIAGTDQKFQITVHNYGPSDNKGFTATLTLPSGVTSPSGTGCTGTTCTASGLGAGLDKTFTITAHIAPSFTNPTNDATLHYSWSVTPTDPTDEGGGEGAHADSTGDKTVAVTSRADLDITQHDFSYVNLPASTFTPGVAGNLHSVRYVVTVTNVGPSDARNVTLADAFPSALDASHAKVCLGDCTPTDSYANGAYPTSSPPTLAPNGTLTVTFQAPVKTSQRDRPNSTNTVTAASPTVDAGTDPDNRSGSRSDNITTVPDAPTLVAAEPGPESIAVQWRAGDNGSPTGDNGNGGSPVTDWVILVRTSPTATPKVYVRSDATGVTHAAGGDISVVVPGAGGGSSLTNGTNYIVTVAARNGAGDSTESNAIQQVKPCATCVIRLLGTGQTTLNTASLAVGTGACFPPSTDATKPGATSADPVVSCFQLTAAQAAAKAGFVTALRETGVAPGYNCGTGTCVGGSQAVSLLIPPGQGTDTQIIQTVLYDKTVASSVYGDLCNSLPCPSKAKVYDVFLNSTFIGSSLTNGDPSTARPAWCTLTNPQKFDPKNPTAGFNPVTNPYVIPAGKTACVVSYIHINTSANPSKVNGNTPNGKEGNGDFRLDIVFLGDGGLSSCRACK